MPTEYSTAPMYAVYYTDDLSLAWSNEQGWVSGPEFTRFTAGEALDYRPPIGGVWRLVAP